MSYVSDFDEDVFISYAHNDDDGPYSTEPKRWVAQLHSDLEQRVKVHLGARPSLWRDCEIRNNEDFEKKILNRLVHTATLLSIISPSFVEREWCIRELEAFAANAESFGIRVDDDRKKRIFKVEKVEVDPSVLPSRLQGSGSYKFYGPDPQTGKVHEYRSKLGTEFGLRYFEQMDELARDIAVVLRGLVSKTTVEKRPQVPVPVVYLAETTPDLVEQANEIRRDLKGRGYTVVPPGDLPYQQAQFQAAARAYLERSAISIHLIGREYGALPEGETYKSKAWIQTDLAGERGKNGNFVRLVWMPRELPATDERQTKFISHLLEDPAAQAGTDVLQTNLEELKTLLQSKLGDLRAGQSVTPDVPAEVPRTVAAAIPATQASRDEPVRIYIICEQADYGSASLLALKKYLFSQTYEPILLSANDNEKEALQEHADNLALCDVALIYYGAGSEKWFNTKLMDFRKFLSRREHPVLAKGVYIAPRGTVAKVAVETHEAEVIHGSDPFSPEPLEQFVREINRAADESYG
jgi:hypothetical protein